MLGGGLKSLEKTFNSDCFLSPVKDSLKRLLGLGGGGIESFSEGSWEILRLGSFSFEWGLLLLEGARAGQYPITWHDTLSE